MSEQLTLWPGAFPASPSASRGSARASRTPAGCGPRCSGSCPSCDPVGCSLRTCLASGLSDLTGCSKTWSRKATPAGRSWWVLMTLAPRTGASGCGSLAAWPTVDSFNRKSRKALTASVANGRRSGGGNSSTLGLEQAASPFPPPELPPTSEQAPALRRQVSILWPTATAQDAAQSGAAGYSTESGRHPGTTLTDAASGLWASPQAGDWRGLGEATPGHSPQLRHSAGLLAQGSHSTHGRSPDSWPTPLSQPASEASHGQISGTFRTQMERKGVRGVLHSRWVAQLMGYPSDWCDVPTEKLSAL